MAVAVGALIVLSPASIASAADAHPSSRTRAPSASDECQPIPLTTSYSADASGKKVESNSSRAVVRKADYRLASGDVIETEVPPADFNAGKASRAQLNRYHLPPRPSGGAALRAWMRVHAGPRHRWVLPDHLCQSDRQYSLYSKTHSGLYLPSQTPQHNSYWDTAAEFQQPAFNAACKTESSYSMWPGIGDNTHLIQAGTDVKIHGKGTNDVFAWYELIGPKANNVAVDIPSKDMHVRPGDKMWVELTYVHSERAIALDIANITEGGEYFQTIKKFAGHNGQYYYSGDSTQYVAERATKHSIFGDKILNLRQPQGRTSRWLQANANRTALDYPSGLWDKFYMTSNGKKTGGHWLSRPSHIHATSKPLPKVTWQVDWYACS